MIVGEKINELLVLVFINRYTLPGHVFALGRLMVALELVVDAKRR